MVFICTLAAFVSIGTDVQTLRLVAAAGGRLSSLAVMPRAVSSLLELVVRSPSFHEATVLRRCQSDRYTVPDPGSILERKFSTTSSVVSCGTVRINIIHTTEL